MEINNNKLIELFGTDKNRARFEKYGKVDSGLKKTLLDRAQCEYLIKDLGRGKYDLGNKRPFKLPRAWFKIEGKKEEYLCYLILSHLKENAYSEIDDALDISLTSCYTKLKAISENYIHIRSNQAKYSDERDIPIENVKHFFDKTTSSLKYYLEKCLNLLQETSVLKWQSVRHVRTHTVSSKWKTDKSISVTSSSVFRRATKEETQAEERIFNECLKSLKISSQEAYFGEKCNEFKKIFHSRLRELNIVHFYDCYEVYYCNVDRLDNILKSSNKKIPECEEQFNIILQGNILENAEKYLNNTDIENEGKIKINMDTFMDDIGLINCEAIDINADDIIYDNNINSQAIDVDFKFN